MSERAFPSANEVKFNGMCTAGHAGMTLRDYIAAKAMQGILAGRGFDIKHVSYEEIAKESYEIADAMLAERNRDEN